MTAAQFEDTEPDSIPAIMLIDSNEMGRVWHAKWTLRSRGTQFRLPLEIK
jgi:hypothetical protein